jgi:hypothetical protein
MLPRAIFISPNPSDALFETGAVFVIGNLVAFTFSSLHKERVRRVYLAAVNQISGVLSQSLELNQVLGNAIDNVIDMKRLGSLPWPPTGAYQRNLAKVWAGSNWEKASTAGWPIQGSRYMWRTLLKTPILPKWQ